LRSSLADVIATIVEEPNAIERLGAATVIALIATGQMIGSLAFDHSVCWEFPGTPQI
jgi:uncharacterized membrane protein YdcZ (DUF606 family)